MQTVAILGGLPGSGKSTLARELKNQRGFYVVSADGLRFALNAGVYPSERRGDYQVLEPFVQSAFESAVRELLKAGHNVGIDATNLTPARRARWRSFVHGVVPGVRVEIHWCSGRFDTPKRWEVERGVGEDEYREIRARLERDETPPTIDEADRVYFHLLDTSSRDHHNHPT